MIIDFHSHLYVEDWRPDTLWQGLARLRGSRLATDRDVQLDELKAEIVADCCDPTGEKQINLMDEAGIDLSVLCPLDWGIGLGESPVSIEGQLEHHLAILRRFPGRYTAFVGVDPRREGAVELLERGVTQWGFRGLKLHPAAGFYPDDRDIYPIYEKAAELGVPVITHTGASPAPLRSKYTVPVYLDDVVTDFPELTVIAAHMGQGWWQELASLAHANHNLLVDISGTQPLAVADYGQFCRVLRTMITSAGPESVLFGTDGLVFANILAPKHWVQLIRDLPRCAPNGISFTDAEVEAILGANARRILGL